VLGLEEMGKVILDIWASDEPLSKPVIRRTAHVRKQAAIGARFICGRKIWLTPNLYPAPLDQPINAHSGFLTDD